MALKIKHYAQKSDDGSFFREVTNCATQHS